MPEARVSTPDYLAYRARRMGRSLASRTSDLAILMDAAGRLAAPAGAALERHVRRESRRIAKIEERLARTLDHLSRLGRRDLAMGLRRETSDRHNAALDAAHASIVAGRRQHPDPHRCSTDATAAASTRPNGWGPGSPTTGGRSPRTHAPSAAYHGGAPIPRGTNDAT